LSLIIEPVVKHVVIPPPTIRQLSACHIPAIITHEAPIGPYKTSHLTLKEKIRNTNINLLSERILFEELVAPVLTFSRFIKNLGAVIEF
jgi:hypothetical protein